MSSAWTKSIDPTLPLNCPPSLYKLGNHNGKPLYIYPLLLATHWLLGGNPKFPTLLQLLIFIKINNLVVFVTELYSIIKTIKLLNHDITQTIKGNFIMSTQEKARALMMRHYQLIKNRQQSMLGRAGEELGLPGEVSNYWNPVQGKIDPTVRITYDRSNAAMS